MSNDGFKDPAEKIAEAMTDIISNGSGSKGRPECPDCGADLWKRRKGVGEWSCPNTECDRGVVSEAELRRAEVQERFEDGLKNSPFFK